VNLIKKIARNTGKSTSLSTSKSASKPTKQTASKEAAIAADPSHKIEIQILSYKSTKDSEDIYTISDTLLGDFIKTIINDQPTDYILSAVTDKEPSTFNQAMQSAKGNKWYRACQDENQSLIDKATYEIVDIPPGVTPIRGR
jgi:hypothetical protein